jgi:hypothetical protein
LKANAVASAPHDVRAYTTPLSAKWCASGSASIDDARRDGSRQRSVQYSSRFEWRNDA